MLETVENIKENVKSEVILELIQDVSDVIGDEVKNHYLIKNILYTLVESLKDAEKDENMNIEFLTTAYTGVIEKARELAEIKGESTELFEKLIVPNDIAEEIQQRAKPILTDKQKIIADEIAEKIHITGLLPYLDNILKNIHLGEHKNIYRKILVLFLIMKGVASFISETTADAEQGKSFEDEIVFNLIAPQRYVLKFNDITSASFKRHGALNPYYFDRKIVLFGDLGDKKAFKRVEDVFNIFKTLITEKEYHSSKADKNDELNTIELELRVNSVGAVYQTTQNSFTKNDNQLESRTIFSTPAFVNPENIAEQISFLENKQTKQSKARQKAEQDLREFGAYLMKMVNTDIEVINPYFDVFWEFASKSETPIREFKQQLELFKAYCIITQEKCNREPKGTYFASMEQLEEYMNYINLENALIPYEYDFLNMIIAKGKANELKIVYSEKYFYDAEGVQLNYNYIKNLKNTLNIYDADGNLLDIDLDSIITLTECENNIIELFGNENAETIADLSTNELKQIAHKLNAIYGLRGVSANHEEKIFFRYSDLKSVYYRYNAFKNVDDVPQLLQTLYNKGYLGKYEYKQGRENLYYLTPLCETLTQKFKPKKTYDEYVNEYFEKAGYENF